MYTLTLTDEEYATLSWATGRGYFPAETFNAMDCDDETEDGQTNYRIPEHAAWAVTDMREDDPHALYTCIGGSLLRKLIALEESIV